MPYTPEQLEVLRKYMVVDDRGQLVRTNIQKTWGGVQLGEGPKLAQKVIDKFLSATDDPAWLDWMFYQAAGGVKAEKAHGDVESALEHGERKSNWLERVASEYSRKYRVKRAEEGMPQAEIEQNLPGKLLAFFEKFNHYFSYGDEGVIHSNPFNPPMAFYREWPGGPDRRYEKIYSATVNYLKHLQHIRKYNQVTGSDLPTEPTKELTPDEMNEIVLDVQHGLGAQKAKTNVKIGQNKPVYDDDYVTVLVPLTHAAAVRYGRPGWAWSDPEAFQRLIKSRKEPDPWSKETQDHVMAYLRFNVPVGSWLRDGKRYFLTNLTLKIPAAGTQEPSSLAQNYVQVYDEENRQQMKLEDVRERIRDEASRTEEDPSETEHPIKQGAAAYTPEEAEKIVAHFDAAVEAAMEYVQKMDHGEVERGFKVPKLR